MKKKKETIDSDEFISNSLKGLLITGMHALYTFLTKKREQIQIANKYKIVNYGFTNFMIVDDKGRHFQINNSIWFWKWDSIEEWEKINKNDILKIKYYGIRSAFLGLFPNIVVINK